MFLCVQACWLCLAEVYKAGPVSRNTAQVSQTESHTVLVVLLLAA